MDCAGYGLALGVLRRTCRLSSNLWTDFQSGSKHIAMEDIISGTLKPEKVLVPVCPSPHKGKRRQMDDKCRANYLSSKI